MNDEVTEGGGQVDEGVALQVSLQQEAAAAAGARDREKVMRLLATLVHEFPGFKEGALEAVERKAGREPGAENPAQ